MKYKDELGTIEELIRSYGPEMSLIEVKDKLINSPLGYKCPKCKGNGYYKVSKNVYPSGLPDSGWAFEQGWENIRCDCCDGKGYTEFKIIEMYTIAGTKKTVSGYCTEDGSKTWSLPEKGDIPF